MNEKAVIKYPKLCAVIESIILLAFPSLYKEESDFSHVPYLPNKEVLWR